MTAMTAQTEATITSPPTPKLSSGTVKFCQDVRSVLEIKMLLLVRGWTLHAVRPLVFPLAIFFWLRVMAPDDPEAVRRIMSGAIIFGITLSTVNMLAQQMILDRFSGRLKLLITMPMAKSAYATGIFTFAVIQTIPTIVLLLALARVANVDFQLAWVFFPFILLILLTMGGLTFLVSGYAPSQEAGGILANFVGIGLVLASPVFFSMDGAPLILRLIGWVSPMRYAADGVMKSLSGRTDVGTEFAILFCFAGASMALGLWRMQWRES